MCRAVKLRGNSTPARGCVVLLTDNGIAFCLRQFDITSDMVVQWGIHYFANALTTIAGQQLDRASDVVHSHDYSVV